MLPCQRHLFDIPDDIAYLNCAYMSPLMKTVADAGREGIETKVSPWRLYPEDFFSGAERGRALFARLIGADAGDIAIVPSASYGIAVAACNLPVARGDEIVLLEDQFPSNVYAWTDLADRTGATIRTVSRAEARSGNRPGTDWTAALLEAIGERTAIVALAHCHWTDGSMVDLEAVSEAARAQGAALVVDATQSLGAMPLDVGRIAPDFLVAATYKWLLGPYSLGFLYVAPGRQQGRPLEHNWITRAGSEDFSGLVSYRDDWQPGARRFDMGERANFQLMPMAAAALEQILAWGTDAIATTLAARTAAIADAAAELGLTVGPSHLRAGHFLGLRFPGGLPDGLLPALAQRNVFVSVRGDSMRVTPHLYNTDADTERLLDALKAVM